MSFNMEAGEGEEDYEQSDESIDHMFDDSEVLEVYHHHKGDTNTGDRVIPLTRARYEMPPSPGYPGWRDSVTAPSRSSAVSSSSTSGADQPAEPAAGSNPPNDSYFESSPLYLRRDTPEGIRARFPIWTESQSHFSVAMLHWFKHFLPTLERTLAPADAADKSASSTEFPAASDTQFAPSSSPVTPPVSLDGTTEDGQETATDEAAAGAVVGEAVKGD